jgi:hypothetical protein
MAELSEVEQILVSTITQLVYPNGTAAASAVGQPCKVYRGWPIPTNLTADLKANFVNISVFPLDVEQNLTRYTTEWQELPSPPISLTMTVTGQTVTIAGMPTCPLNVAVMVNSKAYIYSLQATDTPTSIATALAALISADTPASSTGPVITVPDATNLTTRIGAVGTVIQEVKRQKKSFRISIWCNNPLIRDAVARTIDAPLASLTFINLPDGTAGRIRYERTHTDDVPEKALLFRRDFVYSVEYGTTITQKAAEVVSEIINVSGGQDGNGRVIATINI